MNCCKLLHGALVGAVLIVAPLTVDLPTVDLPTVAAIVAVPDDHAPAATAQDRSTQDGAQDKPAQEKDETQLALNMEEVNRGLRKLRASLKEAERNAESIETVRALELLVLKSKDEKPAMLADIHEDDQAEFLLGFQKALIEMEGKLRELEVAILDGNNEAAEQLRDEVNKLKAPAHERFKADDKK